MTENLQKVAVANMKMDELLNSTISIKRNI